jgi:hypothetical protein
MLAPLLALPPQLEPLLTIDDEVVAFSYAPDGRLAYAVRRILKQRRVEMQRDDIWMLLANGERKRIVNGEKLVRAATPYSYAIQSLRWSPDGTKLTAELLTSQVIDERFNTRDATVTLLLDQSGKEINITGGQSIIEEGFNGAWLPDGATLAFLSEAVPPKLLFHIFTLRPLAGRGTQRFGNSTFAAVAWDLRMGNANSALAIERDASLTGPFRLVWMDLTKETRRDLATLDGFLGQLALSPDASKAAFFVDTSTIEIRDIAQPKFRARLRTGYGVLYWSPDNRRLLIRRSPTDTRAPGSRRSGSLAWLDVPPLVEADGSSELKPVAAAPITVLAGLEFREAAISPDGRSIAVTEPGRRNLRIYPLQ